MTSPDVEPRDTGDIISPEEFIPNDAEIDNNSCFNVSLGIGQKVLPRCTELYIGASDQQTVPSQQLVGEPRAERVTGLIG